MRLAIGFRLEHAAQIIQVAGAGATNVVPIDVADETLAIDVESQPFVPCGKAWKKSDVGLV